MKDIMFQQIQSHEKLNENAKDGTVEQRHLAK